MEPKANSGLRNVPCIRVPSDPRVAHRGSFTVPEGGPWEQEHPEDGLWTRLYIQQKRKTDGLLLRVSILVKTNTSLALLKILACSCKPQEGQYYLRWRKTRKLNKFMEIQIGLQLLLSATYFNQSVYLDNGRLNGTLIKEFSNYSSLLGISTVEADGFLALTRSIVFQTKLSVDYLRESITTFHLASESILDFLPGFPLTILFYMQFQILWKSNHSNISG